MHSDLTAVYGQTLEDVTLPEGWTWENNSVSVGNAGINSFKANYVSVNDNYKSKTDVDLTVKVEKKRATVTTDPTAKNLTFNGEDQDLLNGGEADTFMDYSEDNKDWSSTIPQKKDADTYTIYYRAAEDENHDVGEVSSLTVTINKARRMMMAQNRTITSGNAPTSTDTTSEKYNVKVENGKAEGETVTISADEAPAGKQSIPSAVITKVPEAKTGLVYSGSAQELITTGTATGGTLKYAVSVSDTAPSDSEYATTVPSKKNATTYYVWYKVFDDSGHSLTDPEKLEVSISKKNVTLSAMNASKTYDGSTAATITAEITGKVAGDNLEIKAEASFTDPYVG